MQIALMIEGQNGLNWARWKRLAKTIEELGYQGLFRSDHFTNAQGPLLDSLELWLSLAWIASQTASFDYGPLVSPVSFRHPVFVARWAKDLEALSPGRFVLGMGSGWQEREHRMFGFPLLDVEHRMARFEEGVGVAYSLLRQREAVDFKGRYYQLEAARLLPYLADPARPPLLIGGNGPQRTLPLAARFADEWNGVFIGVESFRQLNRRLTELVDQHGRRPNEVRRSLMTNVHFAADERGLAERAEARGRSLDDLRQSAAIVGTPAEVVDAIGAYQGAGVERLMLQWLDLDDLDGLAQLAQDVVSQFDTS